MQQQPSKPHEKQSAKELSESYSRMLNVLTHDDWREVYLFFAEYAGQFKDQMENAASWDEFVAARTLYRYVCAVPMQLPEIIKGAKEALDERAAQDNERPDEDDVVDYEQG